MKLLNVLVVAGSLYGGHVSAQPAAPPYVAAAIADPARGGDAKADARRHAAELAVVAHVKPGDTVVDLVPGGGYFTRIFSQIVGPTGHVYMVWPEEYARIDGDEVLRTKAMVNDRHYANVTLLVQPAARFDLPVKADIVWTSENYHDYPDAFMGSVDLQSLDGQVWKALKPGGVLVVIDHVARPGSGLHDTEKLHRIDPDLVKAQAIAAGFKLDDESKVLRNPADPHDVIVFAPSIRGRTDQFVFRFRKPS
jgi:predicted methyltransferase